MINNTLTDIEQTISRFTNEELARIISLAVNEYTRRKPKALTRYNKSEIDALLDEVSVQVSEMSDAQTIRLDHISLVGTINRWERILDNITSS